MYSITAIIAAYNEEKTIEKVLIEVKKVKLINKIIVVSDGSIDRTAEIARNLEVEVVELTENIGKGGALKKGIDLCESDIILLLDADLMGLTTQHIEDLLAPVVEEKADMTIGIFNKGRFSTDLAQKVTPYLSGQRALRRYIIESISNIAITRYGIEAAMTRYVKDNDIEVKKISLHNLTHMMKEEKFGFVEGFKERMKMYWEVFKTFKAGG